MHRTPARSASLPPGRSKIHVLALCALAHAALATQPQSAWAQGTVTATLDLTLQVTAACSVAVVALDLGSTTGPAVQNETIVTVRCSQGAPSEVGLSGGNNVDATSRRLTDGDANFVRYFIYVDAQRTVQWGDLGFTNGTYPAGQTLKGIGNGNDKNHIAYVRTDAIASVVPGTYGDSVIVQVEF